MIDGLFWRGYGLFELGDAAGADIEFDAWGRALEETNEPLHLSFAAIMRAMRALLRGRLDESESLAQQAFAIGSVCRRGPLRACLDYKCLQCAATGSPQGSRARYASHYTRTIGGCRMAPGSRADLIQSSDEEGTHYEFENLAQHDFADLSRDAMWMGTMTYLGNLCTSVLVWGINH